MRWLVLVYGVLAYLLGIRSLLYFVGFASGLPWVKTVDTGPVGPWPQALAINLVLLLVFTLPHSLMARGTFKRVFLRWLPETTLRSTYVLVSAVSLSFLMWQWRPIPAVVWGVDNGSAHKLVIGVAVAGWVLAVLAYYSIGHLELLGLRQAWRHFRGDRPHPGELVTTGVYRYLRDPMYLGFAVGMWSTPIMTAGHLLLSTGMSLYLLIGLHYERRDLVARFGDRYLTYLRTGS